MSIFGRALVTLLPSQLFTQCSSAWLRPGWDGSWAGLNLMAGECSPKDTPRAAQWKDDSTRAPPSKGSSQWRSGDLWWTCCEHTLWSWRRCSQLSTAAWAALGAAQALGRRNTHKNAQAKYIPPGSATYLITNPWRERSCTINAFVCVQSTILGLFEVLGAIGVSSEVLARTRLYLPERTCEQDMTNPTFSSHQNSIPTHLREKEPPEQPQQDCAMGMGQLPSHNTHCDNFGWARWEQLARYFAVLSLTFSS